MARAYGRILVKETGDGVSDLVVSVYQHRPGAKVAAPGELPLGSALTDRFGNFEVPYEPVAPGRDTSLMVAVFAADENRSTKDPGSIPRQQRLLHVSSEPRAAAEVEAYAVYLASAQLEAFGLLRSPAAPKSRPDDASGGVLADSLERVWDMREALAKRLEPRLKAQAKRAQDRHGQAKAWAAGLDLGPRGARADARFAKDAEAASSIHRETIDQGLAVMKGRTGHVRLALSDEEIAELALDQGHAGISGAVPAETLTRRLFAASGGPDLVRIPNVDVRRIAAERRLAELKSTPPARARTAK